MFVYFFYECERLKCLFDLFFFCMLFSTIVSVLACFLFHSVYFLQYVTGITTRYVFINSKFHSLSTVCLFNFAYLMYVT